jgi:hypothetical protein
MKDTTEANIQSDGRLIDNHNIWLSYKGTSERCLLHVSAWKLLRRHFSELFRNVELVEYEFNLFLSLFLWHARSTKGTEELKTVHYTEVIQKGGIINDHTNFSMLFVKYLSFQISLHIFVALLIINKNLEKYSFGSVFSIQKYNDFSSTSWKIDITKNFYFWLLQGLFAWYESSEYWLCSLFIS